MNADNVSTVFDKTLKTKGKPKELTEEPGKRKIMKNLMIVSLFIFFLYVPFDSLLNLQSTMNVEQNMGMISTMIIYIANVLSCLFLPKLIIKEIGYKYVIVFSVFAFSPFFAANFYLRMGTFFPSAAILGIASGILWPTVGTYLNKISELYASQGTDSVDVITSRFFGIFYLLFNCSQICGNLISFYILKPNFLTSDEIFAANNSNVDVLLKSLNIRDNVSCGAKFCGGMNENLLPPSEFKRYILSSFYVCCALTSALGLLIFMDPLEQVETKSDKDDSSLQGVIATLKHVSNTNQLLIVPLTIFSGLQEVFIFADYSKAFVACAWGLHNVSLVFVCFGVVCATMSFFSGRLVEYVPRSSLMLTGAVGNIGVCTVLLFWQPKSDEINYFFILVGVWGLGQGIWLTHISGDFPVSDHLNFLLDSVKKSVRSWFQYHHHSVSHAISLFTLGVSAPLYGHLFKENQEAAFANFRLWYSIACGIGYGCSSFLCMYQKIYILLVSLALGFIGYLTIEIRNKVSEKTYVVNGT